RSWQLPSRNPQWLLPRSSLTHRHRLGSPTATFFTTYGQCRSNCCDYRTKNRLLPRAARSDVPVDGGISSPKPPTANSVDSNAFTAPPPSTIGPPPTTPNVPPSTDACSYYLDGTGAGVVVHSICLHTGDNSWSNCVRGGLMQQWIPRSNPFQLGR